MTTVFLLLSLKHCMRSQDGLFTGLLLGSLLFIPIQARIWEQRLSLLLSGYGNESGGGRGGDISRKVAKDS